MLVLSGCGGGLLSVFNIGMWCIISNKTMRVGWTFEVELWVPAVRQIFSEFAFEKQMLPVWMLDGGRCHVQSSNLMKDFLFWSQHDERASSQRYLPYLHDMMDVEVGGRCMSRLAKLLAVWRYFKFRMVSPQPSNNPPLKTNSRPFQFPVYELKSISKISWTKKRGGGVESRPQRW